MTTKTKKQTRRRAPKAATYREPEPWMFDAFGNNRTTAGVAVNEATALSLTAVFACVRAIAEDVAKVPLIVKRTDPATGRSIEARDHELYSLLRFQPNPDMTSLHFRRAVTAMSLLWGNGFAEIVRTAGGRPAELQPIHPSRVTPERGEDRRVRYRVINDQGEISYISAPNMLHIPGIGSGVVGFSMLKLGGEAMGAALAAERFAASFFGNGTRLAGILKHPNKLTPAAAKNLREAWDRLHSGAENAHKTAVLEEGMEWMKTSADPEEAQMLETRVMSIAEACRLFRVPPHKVFEMSRSTFGNIEHQAIEYVGDALYTWFVCWDQEIKRKLISPREPDLHAEHQFQGLLQGDMAARSTRQRELFNIGAITINEIRRENGLNPIGDEGDVHFINAAMVPAEIAMHGPPQPASGAAAPQTTQDPSSPDEPSQPSLDAMDRISAIIPVYADLLGKVFGQILAFEADRITSASKQRGFAAWASDFFAAEPDQVHIRIAPTIDAFAASAWAILSDKPLPDAAKQAILNETKAICGRHVAESVKNMREPSIVAEWATVRAKAQANTEIDNLAELITNLAGA